MRTAELLYQCLLSEFHGNIDTALRHLCDKYVHEAYLTEKLERCRSRAFTREAPSTTGTIDVPPTDALMDEWLSTGKELPV